MVSHFIRCIALTYWIFKSLCQFLMPVQKSLETYWMHHVLYTDHSDWVEQTCQSNRNSHYEQVDNHHTDDRQVSPHHTNATTIRHTEAATTTQNLPYARTTTGVTLASADATAHIVTSLSIKLMSQQQMTHTIHKHQRAGFSIWTRWDVMAHPLFIHTCYYIFNLQRPTTQQSPLINSTFTVKSTTFFGTAMLDFVCSTCIVTIFQLLNKARKHITHSYIPALWGWGSEQPSAITSLPSRHWIKN